MFIKTANQTVIKDIYLPLPAFMRITDIERLGKAFRERGTVRGELNPNVAKHANETHDEWFSRYRRIVNVSHVLDNFRVTEKGIKANLTIHHPSLVAFEGRIQLVRRAFNDYWRLGDCYHNAPGFFGFDIIAKVD